MTTGNIALLQILDQKNSMIKELWQVTEVSRPMVYMKTILMDLHGEKETMAGSPPPKKSPRFQGLGAKFWWFEEGRLSSTYRGLFPTPWERDGWFDRTLGDQFSTWYSRCIAGSFGGSSTWRFAGVRMERGWCLIRNVDPNSTKLPESPWEMVSQRKPIDFS